MTRLPVVSGKQCVRALEKIGFVVRRQSGSHVIMKRVQPPATVSVPLHRELRPGTLRSIIDEAGVSVDEFVALLKE